MLFQRKYLSNNHLAQVSITSDQEGTMEMKNELLSGVAALEYGHKLVSGV